MAVLTSGLVAPCAAAPALLRLAEQDQARAGVTAGDLIPLERVFAMLRKRYSGDKLDARIRQGTAATYYEVHWLTAEGRKLVILVNARDGTIVETRGAGG